MAKKAQYELTLKDLFTEPLEKAIQVVDKFDARMENAQKGVQKFEKNVEGIHNALEKFENKLDGVDKAADKMEKKLGSARKGVEKFQVGLESVRNGAEKFVTGLGGVGKAAKDFATKIESSKKTAISFGSVLDGVKKVADTFGVDMSFLDPAEFLKKGIEGYKQIEESEASLRGSMMQTGTYGEESFNKIVKGAEELSSHVKFGKAEIIDLQSHLALTGKISSDQMPEASEAVANVATSMGKSLAEAGDMVANALHDPRMVNGFGKNLGIPADTIHSVEQYAKAGNTAKARVMLLHAVQERFKNSAKDAFNADPLARYNKAIENAQESVGEMGMEILDQLKPALAWLGEKLNDIIQGVKGVVQWFKEHKNAAEILKAVVVGFTGALVLYGIYMGAAAVKTGLLSAAQELLKIAMGENPLGAVIVGLTAFIALLYEAYKKVDWVHGAVWAIIGGFKAFGGVIKDIFLGIGDILNGSPVEGIKKIENALSGAPGRIAKGVKDGYAEGIADFNAAKNDEPVVAKQGAEGKAGKQGAVPVGGDTVPPPSKAGGTKSVTINIAINKQIETLNIKTSNLVESAARIQERVAEALTNAVNQSQIIAGGR